MNAQQSPHQRGSFKPGLEVLEDRLVPAAITHDPATKVLWVTGSDTYNDTVSITQDDSADNIHVWVGSGPIATWKDVDSTDVKWIYIYTYGGNDEVTYDLSSSLEWEKKLELSLGDNDDIGADDDIVDLDFMQGVDMLNADLEIVLRSYEGRDRLTASFARTSVNTQVKLDAELGDGDDTAYVRQGGDILTNSSVWFDLSGGKGVDTIEVDCVEDYYLRKSGIDIAKNGLLTVEVRGNTDPDTITTRYYGQVLGSFYSDTKGGDHADTLKTYANFVSNSTGYKQVRSYGEGGADFLDVRVYGASFGPDSIFWVYGGLDEDKATITSNVSYGPDTDHVHTV